MINWTDWSGLFCFSKLLSKLLCFALCLWIKTTSTRGFFNIFHIFSQHSREEVAEVCVCVLILVLCCFIGRYLDVWSSPASCDVSLPKFCFLEGAYDLRLWRRLTWCHCGRLRCGVRRGQQMESNLNEEIHGFWFCIVMTNKQLWTMKFDKEMKKILGPWLLAWRRPAFCASRATAAKRYPPCAEHKPVSWMRQEKRAQPNWHNSAVSCTCLFRVTSCNIKVLNHSIGISILLSWHGLTWYHSHCVLLSLD